MKKPKWLQKRFLLVIHERMLSEFGGGEGIRDAGRLDAALQRPIQAYRYEVRDLFELAASYAAAIVQGHPFIDGNKRTGFIAAIAFLEINGVLFAALETETVIKTLALAASEITVEDYANWLRQSSKSE